MTGSRESVLQEIANILLDARRTGKTLDDLPIGYQPADLTEICYVQDLVAAAFGPVGGYRAPWMGNWYFSREHALFDGLPTNAALGNIYQIPARQSNGLLIDGKDVEILIAYSRDHDRQVGAGTSTTRLGKGKVLYHRTPEFHPVLQARFLANALHWLTA